MKNKLRKVIFITVALVLVMCSFAACGLFGKKDANGHKHDMTYHAAVAASCYNAGNVEYWQCSVCSDCFADKDGKKKLGDVTIPEAHNFVNRSCTICGALQPSEGIIYTNVTRETCIVSGMGTCTDTDVVIVAAHDGDLVTGIAEGAFENCAGITSILLPEGITSIGKNAFKGCTGLGYVRIPADVQTIGDGAFAGCTGLTQFDLPAGVTDIGTAVLSGCSAVTSISVAAQNTVYHSNGNCIIHTQSKTVVAGCGNSVVPSDGSVTAIADKAFEGCTALTAVNLPQAVIAIGEMAFANCRGVTSVSVSPAATSVHFTAFANCPVQTATVPCCALSAIKTSQQSENNDTLQTLTVNGGSVVEEYACNDCEALASVTVCDGVTKVEQFAFAWCENLTSINLAPSVVTVSDSAFYACAVEEATIRCEVIAAIDKEYLTTVILNGGTEIPQEAFAGCGTLDSIVIPEGVTTIGEEAFRYCENLNSITIPTSVVDIGLFAFDDCHIENATAACNVLRDLPKHYLKSVVIVGGTEIPYMAFENFACLESVTIQCDITSIGRQAFSGCSSLESFVIPEGVTVISGGTFEGCESLVSVTIPEGVTGIASDAFNLCTSLTSIVIPSTVQYIYDGAFFGCYRLAEVYNLSSLELEPGSSENGYLAYYALEVYSQTGTSKLSTDQNGYVVYTNGDDVVLVCYTGTETALTLPEGITAIKNYAFYGCNAVTSVIIPDGVTEIGEAAFGYCPELTSVTVPAGVTEINDKVFYYCEKLASVTLPTGITKVGSRAFSNCEKLTAVNLSAELTEIGLGAFNGCEKLVTINFGGTAEQWAAVEKGLIWNSDTGRYTVYCSGGALSKGQ